MNGWCGTYLNGFSMMRLLAIIATGGALIGVCVNDAEAQQSLSALEKRALLAQALMQHVEMLEGELDALSEKNREAEEQLAKLRAELDALGEERDALTEEREKLRGKVGAFQQEQQILNQLLAMYGSGDFEYYEVREGETTESIAANPMVYGDADRATWIEQANSLDSSQALIPGTVLVIPRFSRGMMYDL